MLQWYWVILSLSSGGPVDQTYSGENVLQLSAHATCSVLLFGHLRRMPTPCVCSAFKHLAQAMAGRRLTIPTSRNNYMDACFRRGVRNGWEAPCSKGQYTARKKLTLKKLCTSWAMKFATTRVLLQSTNGIPGILVRTSLEGNYQQATMRYLCGSLCYQRSYGLGPILTRTYTFSI